MTTLDRQIRDRIEAFAAELAGLVREAALQSVQDALGHGGPTARSAPRKALTRRTGAKKKATATSTKGGRIRRSADELEELGREIHAYIRANPGQRLEQIGTGLRVATSELKRPVSLMMTAKKLRTTGERRGTKYFAGGAKGASATKTTRRKAKRKKKATRKQTAR